MPVVGKMNQLSVIRRVADGVQLDGGDLGEFFVPIEQVSENVTKGNSVRVFLYPDADCRIRATTAIPRAQLGQCAYLRVLSVGRFGAFMDWGIEKDLLLPHSEQACPVEEGKRYVVYLFQDKESGRIAATTRLHRHLEESSGPYSTGDQVDLLIAAKTELGYKAVIEGRYLGLIYSAELSQPLQFGQRIRGRIKAVRDDGKVDLSVTMLDTEGQDQLQETIVQRARQSGGRLDLSDKSSPEAIFREFKVSKKNFKRALSGLYKRRLIRIYPQHIEIA